MKFPTTKITSWGSGAISEERCPKYIWRRLLYVVETFRNYRLLSIAFLESIYRIALLLSLFPPFQLELVETMAISYLAWKVIRLLQSQEINIPI